MNNNIIQSIYMTVRVGAVLGVAFFAFAGEALAAPYLTPVTVSEITGTSAMLTGHVSNSQKQSTVWFEINNNYGGAPTTVSVQGIWNDGSFKWYMDNLTPGQTYSYRSVATDGSSTVYSPMSSFTTIAPKPIAPRSVTYQSSPVVTPAPVVKAAQVTTNVVTVAKEATSTPATPKDQGFTNNNAASVIGLGGGVLPTNLIGWMILIALLLILVIVAHMIYVAPENRRKAALAKNTEEEDLEHK